MSIRLNIYVRLLPLPRSCDASTMMDTRPPDIPEAPDESAQDEAAPLLSVGEAAARLGITPRAVRQRIEGGKLPGTMLDGRWYVPGDVIENRPRISRASRPRATHTPPAPPSPVTGHGEGKSEAEAPHASLTSSPLPPQEEPSRFPIQDATRASLEAVMYEWLTPLVDRIAELERERGRLLERVENAEHARTEADRAYARVEEERAMLTRIIATREQARLPEATPAPLPKPGGLQVFFRWLTGKE